MPFFKDLVEGQLFVLSHFVLEVDGLRPILVCRQVATLVFDGQACSVVFLACLCEITLRQSLLVLEIPFFRFENVHLLFEDFYLGVQHELLPLDFETLLGQVIDLLVKVSPHLPILVLEQADVLVTGLVVVVETANPAFLRIFQHLLFQYFQLQVHEVDLLLQVYDVFVCFVNVWVSSELAWLSSAFVLPTQLHPRDRIVA